MNPLTVRIKEDYSELFQFVNRSLAPLSMWTGQKISDEEIGFLLFTLAVIWTKTKGLKESV
ncbi:PRD domain-containing protein [Bacillus sp. N9]